MIECIPNISEGCDRAAIDEIVRAVSLAGCRVLDLHRDVDHHRSVITFVGEPDTVVDGAFALAREAVAHIDLRVHRGVHPRIGAIDVIPFVPIGDATADASLDDCVAIARRVGARIGDELGVPVFLYEAAATRPERRNLADVRRGGWDRIAAAFGEPEGRPDFGPARLHPSAGAVAVGARRPLVAYNVVLDTDDRSIARAVAGRVREASGGLAGVKALGLLLAERGLAQVSMNLTDIAATTVPDAFDAVTREAAHLGAQVVDSEIVGLVPRAAVAGATTETLRLRSSLADKILEDRIGCR